MPGPSKQPKALKELKGTHRPSRETPEAMELATMDSLPTAPDDLPEAGKQAWYRVVEQLQALKILTILDYDMLKSYCFQISVMEEAQSELEKPGGKIQKMGASFVKSPWVGIYNDAASQANRIAQQFGFTPAARTKISLSQV